MKIINRKLTNTPGAIYVGRGTPLGSPHSVRDDFPIEEVMRLYEVELINNIKERKPSVMMALRSLNENSVLSCSCKPKPCHADIITKVWKSHQKEIQPPRSMTYAGIGARLTPAEDQGRMKRLAARLSDLGFTLYSGRADGADQSFEAGAKARAEIFVPWKGFNEHNNRHHLKGTTPSHDAHKISESIAPHLESCSRGVQNLMARNVHQILGKDLMSPVDFVICWTKDGATRASQVNRGTGGTGHAINLADKNNIPVFNLKNKDEELRLAAHIKSNPMYASRRASVSEGEPERSGP